MTEQLTIFNESEDAYSVAVKKRSGTFIDNMSLPIHRWFRYSAGFSAQWVESVLKKWQISDQQTVLDPFTGSATVNVVCDSLKIRSIGVEAHPFVSRIGNCKLKWNCSPDKFIAFAQDIYMESISSDLTIEEFPQLINRSFTKETLGFLSKLKRVWVSRQNGTDESELVWLVITALLRVTSTAGTAQWQYILPNKQKVNKVTVGIAYQRIVSMISNDLTFMQQLSSQPKASIITGDARQISSFIEEKVDAVVTSPPYANNYDYADALRFEMTFWGEVSNWGDIHDAVRKYLMVSSSQHASKEKYLLEDLLSSSILDPIKKELTETTNELAAVRLSHGGKKHYHTMIAAYCRDIGTVLRELRRVSNTGANMCWVIGDSAPYGVYCPIDKWIGELALAEGFHDFCFEKNRDRNIKWKNRKHRVPLKEGLLWIRG